MRFTKALRGRRRAWAVGVAWGVSFAAPPVSAQEEGIPIDYDAAIAQSGIDGSYGYLRALDGSATLIQGDTRERVQLSVNEPVLVGDRIFVSDESRIEIMLADGNLVRIGDRAELLFRALANSADTSDPASILELARGSLQLVAVNPPGSERPSVITPNATIRPQGAGAFLIVVDDERRSEVVVREGVAEVTTPTELAEVRPGESLFVEGPQGDRLRFAAAPGLQHLEAWGRGLGEQAGGEYAAHVDPDLHYAASSLGGHGSWVQVDAGAAWRPRVSTGWAPYRHGRWRNTPSGMFWVSYEPWGWVPYHYGYWDLDPDWGWIWFPGSRFAVAHVYWYWGPSYAGWIPSGYYWRHYRNHYGSSWGFHFGVYGHIGGGFGRYRHWTFLPHGRLGHRRQHFYSVGGSDFSRGRKAVERGVLLTDSRLLGREARRRPAQTLASLRRAVSRDGRTAVDANGFIDRGASLPREVERVVMRSRDGRSASPRDATVGARSDPSRTAGAPPVRVNTRSAEGRALRLERPGVQRANPPPSTNDARSTVRRPVTRDAAGSARRPAVRPTTRSGSSDVQRARAREQPAVRPTTRSGSSGVQRARAREQPAVRRIGGATTRPTVRSNPVRPTVRSAPARPTARSNPRRPTVRSAPARPAVRPPTARPSRPVVRPAPSTRRPVARQSVPRPSRPAVRPAGPSRSSGGVGRSSGGSRSGGAVRRTGGSTRSSGVARARGRSGGSRPWQNSASAPRAVKRSPDKERRGSIALAM